MYLANRQLNRSLTTSEGTEVSCLNKLGWKAAFFGVVPIAQLVERSVGRASGFSAGDLVPYQRSWVQNPSEAVKCFHKLLHINIGCPILSFFGVGSCC